MAMSLSPCWLETDVCVSGADVYVAGYEQVGSANMRMRAKYWKNGEAINLSDGLRDARALGIVVVDNP